jgi:hypothetical protein
MPDVAKILRLVEQGALSPEEADQILAALVEERPAASPADRQAGQPPDQVGPARHLRVEITEHGQRVVNLRVPINVANFAVVIVPGLSDDQSERIRQALHSGARGPIVDIASDDGDRVLIVSE